MVPDLAPILAWSEVTGPGEAIFWAHNLFETALESPASPLSQSGLTSMLKIVQNGFSGPYFKYYLDNNSILSSFAESWIRVHRARRSWSNTQEDTRKLNWDCFDLRDEGTLNARTFTKTSCRLYSAHFLIRRRSASIRALGRNVLHRSAETSPIWRELRRFGGNSGAWQMNHFRTRSRPCSRNQLGPKLLSVNMP